MFLTDEATVKPPVFESPIYPIEVPENAEAGTTISVSIRAVSTPGLDVLYKLDDELIEIAENSPTGGITLLRFKVNPSEDHRDDNFIREIEISANVNSESGSLTGKTILLVRFDFDLDGMQKNIIIIRNERCH